MLEFLNEYLTILKVEKNLSDNSINSYRTDLIKLFNFLEKEKITDLNEVSVRELTKFFEEQKIEGINSRSASRYLSSVKGLFSFLSKHEYIRKNPASNLKSAKMSRDLPVVLSFEEIENILSQPNQQKNLGLRDKAILELMYSSGLRVLIPLN